MIVYAIADIHGRADRLTRIREMVREHRPDILVAAGDLMDRKDPEPVARCLGSLDLPVLLVRGNTDPAAHMAPITALPNVTDLHLSAVTRKGFRFSGIGGTVMLPLRSRIAWRERALLEAAAALLTPQTVLVVHPPPRGCRDRVLGRIHAGSSGIAELMHRHHPLMVICGHIHEAAGAKQVEGTTIVNCTMGAGGSGAIIRLASVTGPEVIFP
ncbi:MAG: metallophosphoesterase [Pseudomonadota bacterium]